ncbi:hypothetical protein HYH02_002044 [Chlamydomonas schloesseri]|uniref:Uncharacterized protein n=1 Tax=Chlamydomonas schloesseri TaxID=2026947 RepID=A0A835WTS0_9CHLO|nr:hypothetical protein HYH02_002044 [Chlamydomonas schloesseri]|eukprot:KAG2453837.1 hypothetical protein HYH02_002044 [Chlamydomonas schloesseri]
MTSHNAEVQPAQGDSRADAPNVIPENESAAEQDSSLLIEQAQQRDIARPPSRASASSLSNVALPVALGAVGVAIFGTVLGLLFKRPRKAASKPVDESAKATAPSEQVVAARACSGLPSQAPASGLPVDLSPFGSPVGGTPARIAAAQGKTGAARRAESDVDDAGSDNASVRDQRQGAADAAALQKMLRQMQEMAEENRKLSVFLAEHKASTEKLLKLEQENAALRDVTSQLEEELKEIKSVTAAALPRTGAELEAFKRNVSRVPNVARSVCSNDETVVLGMGVSTASVDEGTRVQRANVFKTLLANLTNMGGTPSAGNSVATTPRGSAGGAGAGQPLQPVGGTSRNRRGPAPEEAAAIGQAVFHLLDQFGGRMS